MPRPWLPRLGKKLDIFFEHVEQEFVRIETALEQGFPAPLRSYKVEKGKGETHILVEVPGCGPEGVKVALAEGIVTVEAQTINGGVAFRFRVGPKVDVGDITATVKHGLLTLIIKRDQQPAPPSGTVKVTG